MKLTDLQANKPLSRSIRDLIERDTFADTVKKLAGGPMPGRFRELAEMVTPASFAELVTGRARNHIDDLRDLLSQGLDARINQLIERVNAGLRFKPPADAFTPDPFLRRPDAPVINITIIINFFIEEENEHGD